MTPVQAALDEQKPDSATSTLPALAPLERNFLLHVARRSLESFLATGELPHWEAAAPPFSAPRAVFVTLRRRDDDELRGCRGESQPRHALIQAVALMAVAAGVDDPRFWPVTAAELPELCIEISVLSPLVPIAPEEVVVGRHGLLVIGRGHAGLLLPQVPGAFGWDRPAFLGATCEKAGLPPNAWHHPDVKLYGFTCEFWSEADE